MSTHIPNPTAEQTLRKLCICVHHALEKKLQKAEEVRDLRMAVILSRYGISMPKTTAKSSSSIDKTTQFQLNKNMQQVLSELVNKHGFTLQQIVELSRGQSSSDPRPNKVMTPQTLRQLLTGYEHCELICDAAYQGINPAWTKDGPAQLRAPSNYKSADRHINTIIKSIREGQDGGQYLVLDDSVLKSLPNVQISPLGAVPKANTDPKLETRLIHDLSFPTGNSTNDASNKCSFPAIHYQHVAVIARRIEDCHQQNPTAIIHILKGDVKSAFRHLMMISKSVQWMGAKVSQHGAIIIDMAASFGWTGSPACYGAFGGAISWLVGRESPATLSINLADTTPFFAYEWVDDHVLVELHKPGRLDAAASALRLAMMAVLGPRAINEKKFSSWSTKIEVLGLEFDTIKRTVSMPTAKLIKAQLRVRCASQKSKISKHDLQCIMGSLRHVSTCLRSAKPFYQRLQTTLDKISRWGIITIDTALRQDLDWCDAILSQSQWWSLPTSMFCANQNIDVHLYMDSSDQGLAVLDPAHRRFIQLKYDEDEQMLIAHDTGANGFNINVREHFCIALASWIWGPLWKKTSESLIHVRAWTDNTSAAGWTNNLYSRNQFAQELNRAVGLTEVTLGFRIFAGHLPGNCNTLADAGSRAWTAPYNTDWTNLTFAWTQDQIPNQLRRIYKTFSPNYNQTPLPARATRSTRVRGKSGVTGATDDDSRHDYPATAMTNPFSWLCLQYQDGYPMMPNMKTLPLPSCPNSAKYHGIIDDSKAERLDYTQDIKWRRKGCRGCRDLQPKKNLSPHVSCVPCAETAISAAPTIASCGGLLSWATCCCCGEANT